jgi:hypothetical protein
LGGNSFIISGKITTKRKKDRRERRLLKTNNVTKKKKKKNERERKPENKKQKANDRRGRDNKNALREIPACTLKAAPRKPRSVFVGLMMMP